MERCSINILLFIHSKSMMTYTTKIFEDMSHETTPIKQVNDNIYFDWLCETQESIYHQIVKLKSHMATTFISGEKMYASKAAKNENYLEAGRHEMF